MNKFAQKIKEHFNNELVEKANNSFNVSFSNWDKPLFRGVDDRLSKEYGNKTKRSDIIKLYSKEESIYEAFLCTMVWGNLGMGRFQYQVDDVFDANKKLSITKKLINVREILKKADPKNNNIDNVISEAFKSMKNKPNHISSVGPAFFTKVLYFIGQTVNWGDMPQPLIYDSIMMRTHEAILKTNYTKQERIVDNSKVSDYLEYIKLMREISDDIGIDPGHLEALLFSPCGREFVNEILGNKTKSKKNNEIIINNKSEYSLGFWGNLEKEIPTIMKNARIVDDSICEIKLKNKNCVVLRMRIYSNGYKKNGYQAFGIDNLKEEKRDRTAKSIKKHFVDAKVDYRKTIIIRNMNPDYENERKKIEWFVENIQKIIAIIE